MTKLNDKQIIDKIYYIDNLYFTPWLKDNLFDKRKLLSLIVYLLDVD